MILAANGFFRSLAIQWRVIGALVMRETHTRYGRENIGFLWVFLEPILFCGGVTIMWSLIRPSHEHGIPVAAFVVTGYNPLTMWRHCVSRSVKAFEANGSLLFHRQVTPLDIILSRLAIEIAASTAGFVITAGVVMLAGYLNAPKDLGLVYLGWFFVAFFSVGTSLVMAGLTEVSESAERFVQLLMYLSIPFSGAFTMVDWLPKAMQKVLLLSPSVHAYEMIRGGWFGPTSHPHYSVAFATASCTILMMVGLYVVKKSRKYILVM